MLSFNTIRRLRIFIIGLAIFLSIVGVLAYFSPQKDNGFADSFRWWLIGLPAFLIFWFALESFGTWILGRNIWQRMPSPVRIGILVLFIVLVVVAFVLMKQNLNL